MARPYSAGDLSRAQRARHAVGPLLPPLAAFSNSAGLPPPVFPAPSLLFPTAITTDLGPVRGCGREGRTWRPLLLHSHFGLKAFSHLEVKMNWPQISGRVIERSEWNQLDRPVLDA